MLALLAAGCSGQAPPPAAVEGTSVVASGVACVPASPLAGEPAAVPLALPPGAAVTEVTVVAGQRLLSGRTDVPVDAVLDHFRRQPGYVVQRDEDEGRAGRLVLFGAAGDVTVTVARLTCPRGSTGFTVVVPVTQPSPVT